MAKQTIGIGTIAGDGTGTNWRDAWDMTNDNFTECYDDIDQNETDIETNATAIENRLILGIAYEELTTNVTKSSTTAADIGLTLNYTPKKANTKLKVELSSLFQMGSGQRGGFVELDYSLDNGVSDTQKRIFSLLKHEIGAGTARENANGVLILDTPETATPEQCIFKLRLGVFTSGINCILEGATIPTLLTVTEMNI